jgi:predicted transcriptional regulator
MVSDDLSEFTPQQRNIMAALRAHRHEIGMHITEVARATNLSIQTIRTELEQLASEGHIYNTIDNDHFRTVQ